jgi:hypothetical protein
VEAVEVEQEGLSKNRLPKEESSGRDQASLDELFALRPDVSSSLVRSTRKDEEEDRTARRRRKRRRSMLKAEFDPDRNVVVYKEAKRGDEWTDQW